MRPQNHQQRNLSVIIAFEHNDGARLRDLMISGAWRQLLQLPTIPNPNITLRAPLGRSHHDAANTIIAKIVESIRGVASEA